MRIIYSESRTRLKTSEGIELSRFQYRDGVIDWNVIGKETNWRLADNVWFLYDYDVDKYIPVPRAFPLWEEEYQALIKN